MSTMNAKTIGEVRLLSQLFYFYLSHKYELYEL